MRQGMNFRVGESIATRPPKVFFLFFSFLRWCALFVVRIPKRCCSCCSSCMASLIKHGRSVVSVASPSRVNTHTEPTAQFLLNISGGWARTNEANWWAGRSRWLFLELDIRSRVFRCVCSRRRNFSPPPLPPFFFLFTPLLSNLQNVQHFALFFLFFAYRWAFYFLKRKLLRIKKERRRRKQNIHPASSDCSRLPRNSREENLNGLFHLSEITKCQGSTGRLVATKRLAGTKNDGNITYQLNPLH